MPGGSHNRNTKKSLDHVFDSVGKFKVCKCPLHRNGGKGTKLSLLKFKRHGSGSQGMCFEGKTLIDSYSHMLKRLQLLAVASPHEIEIAFSKAPKKYISLIKNIKDIIDQVLKTPNNLKFNKNEFNLFLLTELDKQLKTKETGFYDIKMLPDDKISFNEYLKDIFTPRRKILMEKKQAEWTQGCFIVDSKDGKLYPIEEFVFNVSKKRELYNTSRKITDFRVNIHNTRAKGQRSSTLRGERYLADGEYTEANRAMRALGDGNKNIHADHIIPLALGGIHDKKNLQSLPGRENIYKKDKLTEQGLNLLQKDITFLSAWHHTLFNKHRKDDTEIIQEVLKSSVHSHVCRITNMGAKEKFKFVQNFYPNYSDKQIRRIIKKHFTKK